MIYQHFWLFFKTIEFYVQVPTTNITHIDWSSDSTYIQCTSGDCELSFCKYLFWYFVYNWSRLIRDQKDRVCFHLHSQKSSNRRASISAMLDPNDRVFVLIQVHYSQHINMDNSHEKSSVRFTLPFHGHYSFGYNGREIDSKLHGNFHLGFCQLDRLKADISKKAKLSLLQFCWLSVVENLKHNKNYRLLGSNMAVQF